MQGGGDCGLDWPVMENAAGEARVHKRRGMRQPLQELNTDVNGVSDWSNSSQTKLVELESLVGGFRRGIVGRHVRRHRGGIVSNPNHDSRSLLLSRS